MNPEVLQQAAECYGVAAAELKPVAGGHYNAVFGFSREGVEFILRLAPPDEEFDRPAMQAVLEWMAFLAAQGAPVARIVPSVRGALIETAESEGREYLVTVFEKVCGILGEELDFDDWDAALYRELGRVTGRLHALAKTYQPAAGLQRPQWDAVHNNYTPRYRDDPTQAAVHERRAAVLAHLRTLPRDPESYGLIHGDFHGGNFLVDRGQNQITVIDFDDCMYGWYLMDVAMHIFDMNVLYTGPDRAAFTEHFWRSYLPGYLSESPLPAFWIAQLPHFLKLLEIGVYLQVYRGYDPAKEDPWLDKFMPGRRERIEQGLPYAAVDFERISGR